MRASLLHEAVMPFPRMKDHVYNVDRTRRLLNPHGYVVGIHWEDEEVTVKYFDAMYDPIGFVCNKGDGWEWTLQGGDYEVMSFTEFEFCQPD
jgi:hypothetical protein